MHVCIFGITHNFPKLTANNCLGFIYLSGQYSVNYFYSHFIFPFILFSIIFLLITYKTEIKYNEQYEQGPRIIIIHCTF